MVVHAARLAGAAWVVTALAGCATQLTFQRREALDSFIGQDRATLIRQLGTPAKAATQGDTEMLTYDVHTLKWVPGEPKVRDITTFPEGPWVDRAHCATTFRLAAGRVDAWSLEGNDCRDLSFPARALDGDASLQAASIRGDRVASFQHSGFPADSEVG
jgi:hypothetical protein